MKNSVIVLQNDPQGVFLEGVIEDTSLPGTCMEMVPQANLPAGQPRLPGGRNYWRHYQPGADGDQRQMAILLEDDNQGFTFSAPYVVGTRCRLYVPALGEDINILAAGQAGTGSADVYKIGERLIPLTATGMFGVEGTASAWAPFEVMEYITLTPDVPGLVWCRRIA